MSAEQVPVLASPKHRLLRSSTQRHQPQVRPRRPVPPGAGPCKAAGGAASACWTSLSLRVIGRLALALIELAPAPASCDRSGRSAVPSRRTRGLSGGGSFAAEILPLCSVRNSSPTVCSSRPTRARSWWPSTRPPPTRPRSSTVAVPVVPTAALPTIAVVAASLEERARADVCGGQAYPVISRPRMWRAMIHFWISFVPS